MKIDVKTNQREYPIYLERGILYQADRLLNLNRKVLIVTDDGVPPHYAQTVAMKCANPFLVTLPQGESTKCQELYFELLRQMVSYEFTRTDCVIAVGGGVIGDLAGFAASTYMRGIDFYNIPTTLLAQVDSSVGGKTAIDFENYKNIIGSFWQPSAVLIDPEVLRSLPRRQLANGLAEAVKSALIADETLFELLEQSNAEENLDKIIAQTIEIKRRVIEQDELESGMRKILNFGHTLAHAMESCNHLENYYHGECVAAGMIPMCSPKVRQRLIPVLERLQLPTSIPCDLQELLQAVKHDKKASGDRIRIITVAEIGSCSIEDLSFEKLENRIREAFA